MHGNLLAAKGLALLDPGLFLFVKHKILSLEEESRSSYGGFVRT